MSSFAARLSLARSLAPGERDRVLRDGPVMPHWAADSRCFWYAGRDCDGLRWWRVDADAPVRRPLFDTQALADALRRQLPGTPVAVDDLPLRGLRVDFAAGVVHFDAFGSAWSWHDAACRLAADVTSFRVDEAVSPGAQFAVSLRQGELWLRAAGQAEGRQLTDGAEVDFGWGDFTDFVTQLSQRLSPEAAPPAVLWSPDGSRLAVFRVDRRALPRHHLVQSLPPRGTRPVLHSYAFPYASERQRERVELWIVGRDGSRVRAAVDPIEAASHRPIAHGQLRWSGDGGTLWLVDGNAAGTRVDLWRIDAASGAATRRIEEHGPAIVRASPTLGAPANFHALGDGRVVWWSQRSGWGHLYRVESDGRATAITSGPWQVRTLLHVDEARERILFTAGGREAGGNPYHDRLYETGIDGGGLVLLTPEPAHHTFVRSLPGSGHRGDAADSIAPDGTAFVDVFSTVAMPPRSLLRRRDGAIAATLAAADEALEWPASLPLPEAFSMPALDGPEDVWGVLYRPFAFDAGQRYPIVELIYAAPQSATAPRDWSPGVTGAIAEQLAALGFAVVVIDGPGTPYRSHAFQLASHGRTELCALPDHVNVLRRLAAGRSWLDLDRVGVVGGSGGGFATVRALATFPDIYRAGVALCGSHDQGAYLPLWSEPFQGRFEQALYDRQDNALIAGDIAGDLLLVHGEMDDNVHLAQTLRIADALVRAGRRFEMLVVPGAGHMLPLLPYVQQRIWDFLFERLLGERMPWPAPPSDVAKALP